MNLSEYKNYLVEKRRYFHQNPETGFNVGNTFKNIKEELLRFGFEVFEESSGVIGVFKNQTGRVIALRSDVDALEIPDLTETSYTSLCKNKNHACGHDGHMAMLLGACRYVFEHRDFFRGTLKVIFQAAEEGPMPGGAFSLSRSIHLKDVEAFFGLHIMSDYPLGTIISRKGPFMAAVDIINISIFGKSSHVANPHLGLNPNNVLSEFLPRLLQL